MRTRAGVALVNRLSPFIATLATERATPQGNSPFLLSPLWISTSCRYPLPQRGIGSVLVQPRVSNPAMSSTKLEEGWQRLKGWPYTPMVSRCSVLYCE
jgi:hypothetical protein